MICTAMIQGILSDWAYLEIDLHVIICCCISTTVASLVPSYDGAEGIHGFVELIVVLCCSHEVRLSSEAGSLLQDPFADWMDRSTESGRLTFSKKPAGGG